MSKDFKLPDLGEGVHEGQIVRMFVKPGDVVREDQPLMEVETDKAAVEIPCPFNGVVEKVHVAAGQLVHVGDVMVTIGDAKQAVNAGAAARSRGEAETRASHAAGGATANAPARAKPQAAASFAPAAGRHKPASPTVRKFARSLNIDLETINGSGPGGRVQRADVEIAANRSPLSLGEGSPKVVRAGHATTAQQITGAQARMPSPQPSPTRRGRGSQASPSNTVAAKVDYSPLPESVIIEPQGEDSSDQYGPTRIAPLTQARKTIAKVMTQSWSTIPHATDCDDADVTELDKLRRGYLPPDGYAGGGGGRSLTMLAFVVRAIVRGLQRFPEFNASFDAEHEQIVYRRYINIGVAVHTERGLIVPVLREVDRLTIPQISEALAIIAEKARTANFAVNETRGGTYTISNAGAMGGSRYSTPIITPGQAAVLAIGRTRWMPWVLEGDAHSNQQRGIAPRLIMPLSHSIDHRILDGGNEIAFMQQVIGDLQNPARLLL